MQEKLAEVLAPFKGKRGATVPVLQAVQQKLGYLPEEAVAEIARFLGTSPNDIFGIVTFYAQFRTTPVGRNRVMVCRGTACHVKGGPRILEAVERELGIKEGETTPDMEYGLETVACFGSCALAPVVVLDKDVRGRMTTAKVKSMLHGG